MILPEVSNDQFIKSINSEFGKGNLKYLLHILTSDPGIVQEYRKYIDLLRRYPEINREEYVA
jgi:hypothetical protein